MNGLKKNWKAIVALVLLLAAAAVIFLIYRPAEKAYETEKASINNYITTLRSAIVENSRYADIQDQLGPAVEELNASRLELYQHFPTELKEEDQIMYVVYLEDTFGTEINFSFGTEATITPFNDGSSLNGLTLTVNYETTYAGFKEMIEYLAEDERITSIQFASMDYDAENDVAAGSLTLLCYIMDSDLLVYQEPNVEEPDTGKENIFD